MKKRRRKKKAEKRKYTRAWYMNGSVCLSYWSGDTRMVEKREAGWYFTVLAEQADRKVWRKFDSLAERVVEDGKYLKVYVDYYEREELLEWLRDAGVEPLEADVHPVDRLVFDSDIEISAEPRVLFFDLETDGAGGWEDIRKHRIISVAYGEPGGEVKCIMADEPTDKEEAKLLSRFLDVVAGYDVLVAWNGSRYDEPVLKARCKRHKMSPRWVMIGFLDQMDLFERYYARDDEGAGVKVSYSLENIAQTVLGKGKLEDVPRHRLLDLLAQDRERLAEYNRRDVQLQMELEEKLRYLEAHAVLAQLCNRFLDDRALHAAHLVDGFVLRYAAQELGGSVRFPTNWRENAGDKGGFEGAYVMSPVVGMHEQVCDLDFSSLYPSIVISLNIGPETKLGKDREPGNGVAVAENGVAFQTEPEGVFSAVSRKALEARSGWKKRARELEAEGKDGSLEHRIAKQRSDAWKVLANSLYGVVSSPFSRFADKECGEAITLTAKAVIKTVIKEAKTCGFSVIYADTDSAFVKSTKEVAEEFAEKRCAEVVDKYMVARGAKTGLVRLKVDAMFDRIFFLAKKRYAGKKDTGKWEIRGLELIRSDGCRYAREMQRRIITFLLESGTPRPQVAERIVKRWADKLFRNEVPVDDLMFAQSLSRKPEEYKTKPVHVRIAEKMLADGKEVYVGMKIPYVLTGVADGKLEAIHVDDFDGGLNAKLYWRRKVYLPTRRILDAVFPEQKDVWGSLLNYDPDEKQQELFSAPKVEGEKGPVLLKLGSPTSEQMEGVKKVLDFFPGERLVKVEVDTGDALVLLQSEIKVRLCPDLVKGVEEVVGRRVYYGPENWD